MAPMVTSPAPAATPLHRDLVELLQVTRAAERDLFGRLAPAQRDAAPEGGGWSPKDVQAHLAAWRGIEARRLRDAAGEAGATSGDPAVSDDTDVANDALHAMTAGQAWQQVTAGADASVEALAAAIGGSTFDALCVCDESQVAGIGANAANHALGHLGDIAQLAGDAARFDGYAADVEAVLRRRHLPPRDAGVMLYNLACHRALTGAVDEARRLLRDAFAQRADLVVEARQDPDLVTLRDELEGLASS
jgi:hypothetical protein